MHTNDDPTHGYAALRPYFETGAAWPPPTSKHWRPISARSSPIAEGMVLYTFAKTKRACRNCYDQCAVNWPPFLLKRAPCEGAGYSIVERTDGTIMWAKDGMPLYYWIEDTEAGMTSGDGVGGNWDVARP